MRFSNQLRESISQGQAEAIRLGNNFIGIEHLFLGLLRVNSGVSALLDKLGIDIATAREEAERLVLGKSVRRNIAAMPSESFPLSDQAEKVILETVRQAKARKSSVVEPDDLVMSIAKSESGLNSLSIFRQPII